MSLSLSSRNPSLIPLTLININKDNRNSSRRTTTTLTDSFSHKFSYLIFRLCIPSLIPLNCYPWQLLSPKYHQSNKNKKPSHQITQIHIHKKNTPNTHQRTPKVAGSILKIFITIQKGKDIIAHHPH